MANGAKTPPASASEPVVTQSTAPEPKAGEERTYTHEELIERARSLYDVSPLAMQGALAAATKKNLTAGEGQKLVDRFLKRPEEVAETEQRS